MQALLIAAIARELAKYAPKGIHWLIDGFVKRLDAYMTAHPTAAAKLEQVAAAGKGDPAALAAVPDVSDGFAVFLKTLLDKVAESIQRPLVRAAFELVASFVLAKLTPELAAEVVGGPPAAPLSSADVSAWQHSVLAAAHAAGAHRAELAPVMPATVAAVPTVNDPATPGSDETAPPVDPAAPQL